MISGFFRITWLFWFLFSNIECSRLLLHKKCGCSTDCDIPQKCVKGRCITPCSIACPSDKNCKETSHGAQCSKDYKYDFCIAALCPTGTKCVSTKKDFKCIPIGNSCMCTQEIDPVCCDGITYDNQCKANCKKAKNCQKGICKPKKEVVRCGGKKGIKCSKGFYCQDDPNDNCDPECGGIDCIGYCVELQHKNNSKKYCGVRGGIQCDEKNGFKCVPIDNDNCNICKFIADCPGHCVRPQQPCSCIELYQPVCCDGTTYSNQCFADCNKAQHCIAGECISCGGIRNIQCSARDAICQDIPTDDCNPECGGKNCDGFCVFPERSRKTCGGFAALKCEKGYHCYESIDQCNAECGGADCGGYCGIPLTHSIIPP